MGCKELIESLHAAGEGRARALRVEAEREIEGIRSAAAKRIEALLQQHKHQQAAAAAEQASKVLAEANASARTGHLRAERGLADRLRDHARASLPSLRNVGYADVFDSFVRELPPFSWKSIRVHPDDVTLARGHFPGAEVSPDPGIAGGFIAVSEGDQVRVVNTFEQRLENLWEELLPELMREAMDLAR